MTKRILIANRGEIAARIARACRELEYTSVGIWTENEPHARHLEFCDEWVFCPGSTNQETYLNIQKLVDLPSKIKSMGFILVMDSYLKIQILQQH